MKQILVLVLAISVLLSACAAQKAIEIREVWARPAAQGENSAIYLVIYNPMREVVELTGVSSEVAEAAEMHESRMEGDVMQMHRRESVPLPANAETTFEPGGLHIMLVGLREISRPAIRS